MDICRPSYVVNTYALEQIVYIVTNIREINYVLDPCVPRCMFITSQSTSFNKHAPSLKFFFNELDLSRIETLIHPSTKFIYLPEAYGKRVIAT